MSDDPVHRQAAFRDHPDGDRIAIGAEMRAMDIELLGVADDRPIDRHRLAHDAEFDEGAERANHAQPVLDRRRMPGRFDIDVAAITIGQLQHLVDDIDFAPG